MTKSNIVPVKLNFEVKGLSMCKIAEID